MSKYYHAYEERYRIVREATDGLWGHSQEDAALRKALTDWVSENSLAGRKVIEFACGEAASALVLADMGCIYRGVDVAPTAIETARRLSSGRAGVEFDVLDLARESAGMGEYDGALDISGLHMLITDSDRQSYLTNMFNALKPGGCAMFWQESYRCDAYEGEVRDFDEWKRITGLDFDTPEKRKVGDSGVEVMLKLLPARPRTEDGYRADMEKAGFVVDEISPLADNYFMACSAVIKVHKPV